MPDTASYAADHGSNVFKCPVCLPIYDGSIANNATTVIRIHAEWAHKARLDNYASFEAAKRGATKFLCEFVDEVWFNDFKDASTFYTKVLAGNVGDMLATSDNVANFCPNRPISATCFSCVGTLLCCDFPTLTYHEQTIFL